jgi:anti-sigma B factor antagonist
MTQLDIDVRHEEGRDFIAVSGPVNSYTFSEFQEKVYKSVLAGDTLVDMSRVTTLSSAGIGVLMAALDEAEGSGHRLAICKPSEIVTLAFESTGFGDRFPIVASAKDF